MLQQGKNIVGKHIGVGIGAVSRRPQRSVSSSLELPKGNTRGVAGWKTNVFSSRLTIHVLRSGASSVGNNMIAGATWDTGSLGIGESDNACAGDAEGWCRGGVVYISSAARGGRSVSGESRFPGG